MTSKHRPKSIFDKIGRSSGILLHPTSLPSEYGIGELGTSAYKFVDLLRKYKQKCWQILPLGPTGYGNSPYQCFSAFAGNPLLISLEKLIQVKLLTVLDTQQISSLEKNRVDYGKIIPLKWNLLEKSFTNFNNDKKHIYHQKFLEFQKENDFWLHDYALFMAIKTQLNNKPWNEWPKDLRDKNLKTLEPWDTYFKNLFNSFFSLNGKP